MTPTQPRTKAGKVLLRYQPLDITADSIAAIEEEAVSEYREALKEIAEAVDAPPDAGDLEWHYGTILTAFEASSARSLLDRSGETE